MPSRWIWKTTMVERHADWKPSHPGELLRDIVLPGLEQSKTEIARLLGVSRETLYRILDEKQPVTPTMAARLGKLFGNGPGLWLRMQADYDTWCAEREIDVSDITTLASDEAA